MSTPSNCIWLVDDDEDDLMLMQAAFQNVAPDVHIKTLHDGEELLPELQGTAASPSLILLDLNMARISGFEALANLRSAGPYNYLPIVMLTTSSNPADKVHSKELGASDYCTKPSNFHDLSALARDLIRQWLPTITA
jgi:DNA-binding response OmpR family regulator